MSICTTLDWNRTDLVEYKSIKRKPAFGTITKSASLTCNKLMRANVGWAQVKMVQCQDINKMWPLECHERFIIDFNVLWKVTWKHLWCKLHVCDCVIIWPYCAVYAIHHSWLASTLFDLLWISVNEAEWNGKCGKFSTTGVKCTWLQLS